MSIVSLHLVHYSDDSIARPGWSSYSSVYTLCSNNDIRYGSFKSFLKHLWRLANVFTGRFQQFDFGAMQNIGKYRSIDPPKYKLSNVKAPISLFYAENDWLSSSRVCIATNQTNSGVGIVLRYKIISSLTLGGFL